jgi:hypothetical protein
MSSAPTLASLGQRVCIKRGVASPSELPLTLTLPTITALKCVDACDPILSKLQQSFECPISERTSWQNHVQAITLPYLSLRRCNPNHLRLSPPHPYRQLNTTKRPLPRQSLLPHSSQTSSFQNNSYQQTHQPTPSTPSIRLPCANLQNRHVWLPLVVVLGLVHISFRRTGHLHLHIASH